ncbi:hypothetical protein P691DRAFT_764715 [Macrolepiota fuliginosa MF-IS2]|uniref:Transmembrane protein n=1 Tax=Macrolepiota fuliginosa MF-IS2 TaxID=1400762 RepID=A0A9P5X2R6_9AGAR|nr:hypothetical protein P691DRAFT_764715 [Macrolepiota fuliginosa MF-IS2]
MLGLLTGLTPAIVTGITDGLLVWRCYAVHQAFEQAPSMWRNIFWIFPALLWILNIVSGIVVAPITQFHWCSAVAFISNAVINLYATVFIALRLLQHRRMLMACLGPEVQTKRHVYILGLLLESAVINVPVALAAAIGLCIPGALFSPAMAPIVGSSQAFASVLIIHQVAMGRAFDQQREKDNTSGMMTEGVIHTASGETAEEVV